VTIRGLLLTPGAGSSADHPSLLAIEEAVRPLGIEVARMDFPYRLAGRRAPDRPAVLLGAVVERAHALAEHLGVPVKELAMGGRSMGGRVCSIAVAEGLLAAGALVAVSYPLHPPGKPDRLRVEHLGTLRAPSLFVSGTKDAFGSPAELTAAFEAIPGRVTQVWIEGGDHGLRRRDEEVATAVARWLRRRAPR
jgi:uncharacterized protein